MQTLDEVYGYSLDSKKEFKPYLKAIRDTIKIWDITHTLSFDAKVTHKEMRQLLSLCMNRINQIMESESRPGHHTGYDPDSGMNLCDPNVKTNSYAKLARMYKYNHTHVPITKYEAYCSKYNLIKQPLALMKLALYRSKNNDLIPDHSSNIIDFCKDYSPMNDFLKGYRKPRIY